MIVDRFFNIVSQAANLASNSKSGFEDLKNAVTAATSNTNVANTPIVVVASASNDNGDMSVSKFLVELLLFVLLLALILFVGLWLWNNVAAKYITIFKPLPNVWYLLGLIITLDLIHPSCMCGRV